MCLDKDGLEQCGEDIIDEDGQGEHGQSSSESFSVRLKDNPDADRRAGTQQAERAQ